MIHIDLAVITLASLPLVVAIIYSLYIVPRRNENMQAVIRFSLNATSVAKKTSATVTSETVPADTAPKLTEVTSVSPHSHHEYIQAGLQRVDQEFKSQYRARLFIPATILTFLYVVTLFLCMVRVSGDNGPSSWLLRLPVAYAKLPNHDFLLYSFIGAYAFNMGALVRRTFLADITEHVYWGAINRLIISTGLALACHSLPLIPAPLYFMIPFMPQVLLTKLRKKFTSYLGDDNEESMDLALQLVQGIDIWKEQRLQEEGIENVQNLATADVLTLAVKTHYPLRTLIDWIDQAIYIQRFPKSILKNRANGLAVSAIEFAWMSPSYANQGDKAARAVAKVLGLEDPTVVIIAMDSFYQDSYVSLLWTLWQADENVADRASLTSISADLPSSPNPVPA